MSKKQRITTSIVGIALILLTLLGITYAYYLTRIEGNTNENSISITTAKLELLYGDGNEDLSFERIMPGDDMEAKTFTVTNNGNSKVNNYAVSLEEVTNTLTRTQDLTYTLTCVQKNASGVVTGECEGKNDIFPNTNSMIVVNSIEIGYVHEYSLKVVYANLTDVDQSDDMGSTIKAKVQIYGLTDTVDLTGSITNASEGDYVQINSVTKKSNIVNGIYKLVGITPGTHTLKVCSKTDTTCSAATAKVSKTIVINKGNTSNVGTTQINNVDVPLITITSDSRTSTVGIDVTEKTIDIDETIKDYDPNEGILAVNFTTSKNISLTTNKIVEDVDIKTDAVSIPFSVKNISDKHQNITIKLTDIEMDDALKNIDFRWGLYNADTEVGLSFGIFKYTTDEELIYTDTIIDAGTETPNNYKLRIWVHNNGTAQTALLNKSFKAKVNVTSDDIEYTPESCFTFDSSTGTISEYDYSCGVEAVVPKTISNVSVKKLNNSVFSPYNENAQNMTKIIFSNGVENIAGVSFRSTDLHHITIPEGVTSNIDLNGSGHITSLFIPSTISDFGDSAMLNFLAINVKSFVVPENTLVIGETVLHQLYSSHIILMNGLTTISTMGISSNPNLESLEIPSSVTTIGDFAFSGNSKLEKIVIRGKSEAPDGFSSNWNCKEYISEGECPEYFEVEFRP